MNVLGNCQDCGEQRPCGCLEEPLWGAMKDPSPWHPMNNPVDLKTLGKFGEELNECGAAVSRCIIQGIDEAEPVTGKINRDWLEDEIADVIANSDLTIERFGLDMQKIMLRVERKKAHLRAWHKMA